ncbi:hypothetical protein BW39_00689 [Delftia sp. RIT313]|nr:hypothetical protein BW39_00689 [Delftia sp. RIT313]
MARDAVGGGTGRGCNDRSCGAVAQRGRGRRGQGVGIAARGHQARGAVVDVLGDAAVAAHGFGQAAGCVVGHPFAAVSRAGCGAEGGQRDGVRHQGGVDRIGIGNGACQLARAVVDELLQPAGVADLCDLAAGLVVDDPGLGLCGVLHHAQASCCVIAVVQAGGDGGTGRVRTLTGQQLPSHIVSSHLLQPIGRQHHDAPAHVVIGGRRDLPLGVGHRQQPPQAVIGITSAAAIAINGLQQSSGLVVDMARDRAARRQPVACGIGGGIGGGDLGLAPEVQHVVGALQLLQVLLPAPCRQGGLGRGSGCTIARHLVLQRADDLAIGIAPVFGDAAFGADGKAQLQARGIVVHIARGLRARGLGCAVAIGVGLGVDGLAEQAVAAAVGARDGVACTIALQHLVAVGVIGHEDRAPVRVGAADQVAVGVVLEALDGRDTIGGGRGDAQQLALGVIGVAGDLAGRVRDLGGACGSVVGKARGLAQRVAQRRHLELRAHLHIVDGQLAAVALGQRGDAVAVAMVGVAGAVELAVGRGAVLRREIDRDLGQAVARVIGIAGARGGGALAVHHPDAGQQVARVLVLDGLTAGVDQFGDVAVGIIGVGRGVAAGVHGFVEAPGGGVVELAVAGGAIGEDVAGVLLHDAVIGAGAIGAHIAAGRSIPGEQGACAIALGAGDGAARLAVGA